MTKRALGPQPVTIEVTAAQHHLCQRLAELNGMSVAEILEAAAEKGLQTLATDVLREIESEARSP